MPTDKKLKSLVLNVMTEAQYNSATKNEDELYLTPDEGGGGAGKTYLHSISIASSDSSTDYYLFINIYSTSNTKLTFKDFEQLVQHYGPVICTGFYKTPTVTGIPNYVEYNPNYVGVKVYYFNLQSKVQSTSGISSPSFNDKVAEVI